MQLSAWSKAIKSRDKKCMHCGSGHDLHAHHIKHKATHPELITELSNGIALCYRCHKAEHEKYRPIRIRSDKPNRATLLKRIASLENKVTALEYDLKIARATSTKEIGRVRAKFRQQKRAT